LAHATGSVRIKYVGDNGAIFNGKRCKEIEKP
jgi:hypothetical protein